MLNSTIALKIAKWCFGSVTLWYAMVLLYTLHDTEVWIDENRTTLWGFRLGIMMASGFLYVFSELLDKNKEDE